MISPAARDIPGEARMTYRLTASEFQERLQHLDTLLHDAEHLADPAARDRFRETVQAILELHGAGLERLLEHVAESGDTSHAILDACARDEVVGGLLLLHGLHPLDMEERVRQALQEVRPYLRSHGGNVELVEVRDGTVRLRLQGSCHHCPSSAITMKQTVEEAVYGKVPEVIAVEVEGATDEPLPDENHARVALPVV
jgi:Fe-S cluster biogenesis protein NfuA